MELFPHSTVICLWNRVSVAFSWEAGSKVCVLMTEQGWSRQEFQPHVYYPVHLISTCSHPNSWLLFHCLSFLAELFSREAPLCTQPPLLPGALGFGWGRRERRLQGGGEQGQSFLPWLPPHFCLVRVMARCHSRRAPWRSVFFRVSHSAAFSVHCHTPPLQTSGGVCSRPGRCLDLNTSACFFSPCLPFWIRLFQWPLYSEIPFSLHAEWHIQWREEPIETVVGGLNFDLLPCHS